MSVFIIAPLSALILAILLLLLKQNRSRGLMCLLALVFSFINSLKLPESDLTNYIDFFNIVHLMSFDQVLQTSYLSIKEGEYLFKIYTWSMSHIYNSSVFYVFVSTFFMYYSFMLLSMRSLSFTTTLRRIFEEDKALCIVVLLWCVLVAVSFSLTAHLIKQYLAISVFGYAIIAFSNRRYYLASFVMLAAVTTHYALIIPCSFLLIAISIKGFFATKLRPFYIFGIFTLSVITSIYLGVLVDVNIFAGAMKMRIGDENSVAPLLMLIDCLIVSLFLYLYRHDKSVTMSTLVAFVVIFIGFMIAIHDLSYIFLRYYFTFDLIRAMLGSLIILRINFSPKIIFIPSTVIIFIAYFVIRYIQSPWTYEALVTV